MKQNCKSPDDPPLCLHSEALTFRDPAGGDLVTVRSPRPSWAA